MFKESPEDIWKWIDSIYHMSMVSKPNQNHIQIDLLAKALSKMGKKVVWQHKISMISTLNPKIMNMNTTTFMEIVSK